MPAPDPQTAKRALKTFLGLPYLLFAVTFAVGSLAILIVLTPARFPVRIGEKIVPFGELVEELETLEAEYASLLAEQERVAALTPTPTLNAIQEIRTATNTREMARALVTFLQTYDSFTLLQANPIQVDFFHLKSGRLSVSGRVKDPNGRSVQILASLVDRLRSSTAFASVSEPEYQQARESDGSTYAPFAMELTFTTDR